MLQDLWEVGQEKALDNMIENKWEETYTLFKKREEGGLTIAQAYQTYFELKGCEEKEKHEQNRLFENRRRQVNLAKKEEQNKKADTGGAF